MLEGRKCSSEKLLYDDFHCSWFSLWLKLFPSPCYCTCLLTTDHCCAIVTFPTSLCPLICIICPTSLLLCLHFRESWRMIRETKFINIASCYGWISAEVCSDSIWQDYCLPLGDVGKHQAVLVELSWRKVVVCPVLSTIGLHLDNIYCC